jgi:D-arabinose 1-dehydrogenase-like Zn-dependent alcohol dehydrogenase
MSSLIPHMSDTASVSDSVGRLEHGEYDPKPFTESDVDIAITHCGICGSGQLI